MRTTQNETVTKLPLSFLQVPNEPWMMGCGFAYRMIGPCTDHDLSIANPRTSKKLPRTEGPRTIREDHSAFTGVSISTLAMYSSRRVAWISCQDADPPSIDMRGLKRLRPTEERLARVPLGWLDRLAEVAKS